MDDTGESQKHWPDSQPCVRRNTLVMDGCSLPCSGRMLGRAMETMRRCRVGLARAAGDRCETPNWLVPG